MGKPTGSSFSWGTCFSRITPVAYGKARDTRADCSSSATISTTINSIRGLNHARFEKTAFSADRLVFCLRLATASAHGSGCAFGIASLRTARAEDVSVELYPPAESTIWCDEDENVGLICYGKASSDFSKTGHSRCPPFRLKLPRRFRITGHESFFYSLCAKCSR